MSIPTFCINLSAVPQRWKNMQRRFAEMNIIAERWEAATPADLGSYSYAHYLSPAQRACAKSHYEIWKHQVANKIPVIMVFEDDALFRKDFWKILTPKIETIDATDPAWDMILLNASEETKPLESWCLTKDQCMTAGYLLSLRGAEEFVRISTGTLYASDWMTQILQRRGHSYTYFPWLVIQELGDSAIRGAKNAADWEKATRLLRSAGFDLSNYTD